MADPQDVDQALDSVGDAVENAVPDPKGAPSGLAPTSPVSFSPENEGQEAQGTIRIAGGAHVLLLDETLCGAEMGLPALFGVLFKAIACSSQQVCMQRLI